LVRVQPGESQRRWKRAGTRRAPRVERPSWYRNSYRRGSLFSSWGRRWRRSLQGCRLDQPLRKTLHDDVRPALPGTKRRARLEALSEGFIFPVEPSSRHIRDALQTFYRGLGGHLAPHRRPRHRSPLRELCCPNCAVERGHRDEIRRVRKIDERLPIDAVPAMALACWRATQAVVVEPFAMSW
jgi:hypothetical protein